MPTQELSAAEVGDRHRALAAFAALVMSGFFAVSAAERVASADLVRLLQWLSGGLALLAVLLVLPILAWKARHRGTGEWHLYQGSDGYVADALAKAHIASWGATFGALVVLGFLVERLPDLPPRFFFDALLAWMLAVSSLTFLYFNRSVPEEGLED